jgi:ElaB/YqjD/DUF883 family membrane-anchored ribosome-binding protein
MATVKSTKANVTKAKKVVAKAVKKAPAKAKKVAKKVGSGAKNLLATVRKKMKSATRSSGKMLGNAKHKAEDFQGEIVDYVKANPVKSASTVALVALIAGYVARMKK